MFEVSSRTAARAAWFASAAHVVAAAAMALLLRPGVDAREFDYDARQGFITGHLAHWRLGWLTWHLAALALLSFYVGLAGRFGRVAPLRCMLALLCAAVGFAGDVIGQALAMGLQPHLQLGAFTAVESTQQLLTAYVANGLYTVAGLLLVSAGWQVFPRWLALASLPIWIAGVGMSVSAMAFEPVGLMASVAVIIPAVVIWTALVGRWLQRLES